MAPDLKNFLLLPANRGDASKISQETMDRCAVEYRDSKRSADICRKDLTASKHILTHRTASTGEGLKKSRNADPRFTKLNIHIPGYTHDGDTRTHFYLH